MKKPLLAFIFPLILPAEGSHATYAESSAAIMEARPCGSWFADRRAGGDSGLRNTAWVAGYLTGVAGREITRGLDRQALELWMDDYCRNNPGSDIEQGAGKLAEELRRKTAGR